uniref:Uncharacterized protein n=1 Tax=Arion vulgaris TaxID=1028688 RepID=A0A0B7AYP6_9EUPU
MALRHHKRYCEPVYRLRRTKEFKRDREQVQIENYRQQHTHIQWERQSVVETERENDIIHVLQSFLKRNNIMQII